MKPSRAFPGGQFLYTVLAEPQPLKAHSSNSYINEESSFSPYTIQVCWELSLLQLVGQKSPSLLLFLRTGPETFDFSPYKTQWSPLPNRHTGKDIHILQECAQCGAPGIVTLQHFSQHSQWGGMLGVVVEQHLRSCPLCTLSIYRSLSRLAIVSVLHCLPVQTILSKVEKLLFFLPYWLRLTIKEYQGITNQ